MTDVRITRQSVRILGANPLVDVRLNRQSVRVLGANPLVDTRLDRQSARVLGSNSSDLRVSRQAINLLATSPSDIRVYRQSGNVLATTPSDLRVYRQAINVLVKYMPNDTVGIWGTHIGVGYTGEVYKHDPISWWRLDETTGTTATDGGSLSNSASIIGTPTLNQTGIPAVGKSILFDGTDDEITAPWNERYRYEVGNNLTYAFWYKGTDVGTNASGGSVGPKAFLAASDSVSLKLFVIGIDASGFVRAYLGDNYVLVGPTTTVVNDDSYHFIALTLSYNGSSHTGTVYIDGVQEATANVETGTGTPSISIGCNPRNASGYISGIIDEVIILPAALDASQLLAIYKAGMNLP